MRYYLALLLLLPPAAAAGSDTNGQWNIQVPNPKNRAWWLEVSGAGTPSPTGSFVGAPGGQVDRIADLAIRDGELSFSFTRKRDGKPLLLRYRARLEGGLLRGTVTEVVDGKSVSEVRWSGARAPKIDERDGPEWKPGVPVELFDGKTVSSWRLLVPGRPGWFVDQGLLKNAAGASDLVSLSRHWNFELAAEFRYAKGSNSGIGVRGRYEVQIQDNFGQPPDSHGTGALYNREAPRTNASNAPGEWQRMVIRIVGRDLTVTLNGARILDRVQAFPTAMTMDPDENQPGPIVLQGDHGPVEFRRLTLTPLIR